MPSRLRAVSLDLDNTLWDTPPVLVRAELALATWMQGHAPRIAERFSAGEFRAIRAGLAQAQPHRAHDVTWLRTESLRRAALETGYPPELAAEAFGVFWRARNEIEPYAEVGAALERLAARVPLFAVTNGNACVRQVGLGAYFKGSIDAATAGVAKPDRQIFMQLVEMSGVESGQIMHVGDDAIADVHGAREAGLRTAWMNRNAEKWPSELKRAEHEVADLEALATLVERLT